MTQVDERPVEVDETVQLNQLRIMDHTGDVTLTWNPRNAGEVETARRAFSSRKADGYLAYKLRESGAKGEVIHTFDPEARSIVMTPQMQGG